MSDTGSLMCVVTTDTYLLKRKVRTNVFVSCEIVRSAQLLECGRVGAIGVAPCWVDSSSEWLWGGNWYVHLRVIIELPNGT